MNFFIHRMLTISYTNNKTMDLYIATLNVCLL